jgi:glycosyltransferase involved in cell wall biosynthesis
MTNHLTRTFNENLDTYLDQSPADYHDDYGAEPLEVSVVIPCLNEENSVGICVDKALCAFASEGVRGEVVVADNGSSDRSVEVSEQHGARVVRATVKGYGNALRKGIEEARGQFIIMGDADDSYDFTQVPSFVEQWRQGSELVLGNRFAGGIKPGAMPWLHKRLGNPAITAILNRFFGAGIGDAYCGMRGFTKRVYEQIDPRTTGMEFALELVIKAKKLGAKVTEIPVTLWPDKRGRRPHLRTFHDGWRSLRFMLLYAPNWLFIGPGAFLLMLGLGLVFWLFPGPRPVGRVIFDIHTMLFGMIFALLGMQIISIGMFAKVFSFAERLAQPAVARAMAEPSTAGARLDARKRVSSHRRSGCSLAALGMDRKQLRPFRSSPIRDFLLTLVFHWCAANLLVILYQHAGHQPWDVHWRL